MSLEFPKLHIAIGALVFAPLAFRVLWRMFSDGPAAFKQPVAMQRLTQFVHVVLLLGISVLIVTGPLAVWTGDRAIEVLTWFSIPSPTGKMESLHEALEVVHVVAAKAVLVAVVLHVFGAFKHLVFERQEFAGRMVERKSG
ncbi:cytochrome b [Sedimenticola selenatireducens]|uniref:cytochrome b n=1 Tax=Sedimenticola selenatireducens TaxID=191960 RepID=UPI0004BCE49E|nr:cytochrome b/b6 domain-containing protein [Sedimenticola selenatireducens]